MTLTDQINAIFAKKASSPAQRAVNAGAPNATESPTDAQKAVGNYRKVHLNIDGFRVSIENPKGSVRSGTSPDGTKWRNVLACDYGDIHGTESVDGDPVDIYLSDHPEKGAVFVIDQIDPKTKKFDEHKVMYGFDSIEDAKKTYLACYQKGWGGLGWITPVTKAEFRKWIDSSTRKTKPFHEYASVTPIVDPIKVKAAEAELGEDDAEHPIILNGYEFDSPTNIMTKQAQSITGYTGYSSIENNPWFQLGARMREDAEKAKIEPDADTRHFFDTIVPYIKSHSETAGTPGVDYNASKFVPGFYRSVSIRKKPLAGDTAGFSNFLLGVRIDPKYVDNSSVLVHELKHQQNRDDFPFVQSGRSAADDLLLSNTYNFAKDDLRPYYPFVTEKLIKYEQGTTHAEHQFAIMRELKEKLGRQPTGEEFVDYVRTADYDTLNAWRNYVPNMYQQNADARDDNETAVATNIREAANRRLAKEEAEKFDFPDWIDYAPKSEMDKYKQQPWYNPDIFRLSSDAVDGGDPFNETTENGISGGFNPKYRWIEGRFQQLMRQGREPKLELFRRALLNVAKNKVRPSGIYQNAQNTMRGIRV